MAKKRNNLMHMLLQEVNPFGIVEGDAYKRYNTQVDAYNDFFTILWNYFPRGYIDIPLFMVTFQGVDYLDALRLCPKDDIVRIPIQDIEAEGRYEMLQTLCKRLLKVTGCEFDINACMVGLHKFNMMMLSERLQSKDINNTIPKFTEDFYEPDFNTSGDSEQQSSEYSPQPEEQLGGAEEE